MARILAIISGNYSSLTSFFSTAFLFIFLPFTIAVFTISPKRLKKYSLLFLSYLFFYLVSGGLLSYLIFTTISIYVFGLWLNQIQLKMKTEMGSDVDNRKVIKQRYQRYQSLIVGLAILLHIGMLAVFKYTGFVLGNINTLFEILNVGLEVQIPRIIMPIGISFFSLQALSYILDVKRGVVKADKNIVRLALFLSFFPLIVEGPICRYGEIAESLYDAQPIKYQNLCFGLQRVLYGMIKKRVIADRLNFIVLYIFDNHVNLSGGVILIGAILYTIQLYMDFSGMMDAALGISEIFGIRLPENFRQPFFSKTISEFWQRWHITLGTWFKDYIFYPLTTTKPMKKLTSFARKRLGNHYGPLLSGGLALFCVWLANGLWHGAAWNYIFFGLYHFALILGGSIISPLVKVVTLKLRINTNHIGYKIIQMFKTTVLVIIGELFFRANGLRQGILMFTKMISDFGTINISNEIYVASGIDVYDLMIALVTLLIVVVISILKEKGVNIRAGLALKHTAIRWALLYCLILYIVIFGAYGHGYVPVDPMYANF